MNREILFRRVYRHRKTGEIKFVEWGVFEDSFRSPASLSEYDVVGDEQYIGSSDKHGIRMFEGDVDSLGREIVFMNGAFMFTHEGNTNASDQIHPDRCRHIEIIGNIHESQKPSTQKQEKLKVWSGIFDGYNIWLVAAKTQKEAAELFGISTHQLRQFGSETGNKEQVELAMSEPRKVFKYPRNQRLP